MWMLFKRVFFVLWMAYFYHVNGGGGFSMQGITTLFWSFMTYALIIGGISWVFNDGDGSVQGSVSPAEATPERRVEREQGELVNARRGNPDPTRPKPEWMDNRPDWMKGN